MEYGRANSEFAGAMAGDGGGQLNPIGIGISTDVLRGIAEKANNPAERN